MGPLPQVEEMFVCASGARIVSRRQIACQIRIERCGGKVLTFPGLRQCVVRVVETRVYAQLNISVVGQSTFSNGNSKTET